MDMPCPIPDDSQMKPAEFTARLQTHSAANSSSRRLTSGGVAFVDQRGYGLLERHRDLVARAEAADVDCSPPRPRGGRKRG